MAELIPDIRNAARALIVDGDRILLLRKDGGGRGPRFALPGGAQEPGESLAATVQRECLEEIGSAVEVGSLVHVADFFKQRDTRPVTRRHVVEFLFRCRIDGHYVPHNGERPDKHQVDVVWMTRAQLSDLALVPYYLSQYLPMLNDADAQGYLGLFQDHADSKEH